VAQFVEELRYKPEGRGFDSRWDLWNFSVRPPQPLREPLLSPGGQRRPLRRANSLVSMCQLSRNSGSLNILES
jgi:hypothetical protein